MRLVDVYAGRCLKVEVGMPFQIGSRHGQGWLRELVYDADGPAFLKMDQV